MDIEPMTVKGLEQLKAELAHLKTKERIKIASELADALTHGDLRENAEFDAAKEYQGLVEARIKEIEGKISHAKVIDVTKLKNNGKVIFGSTVTVYRSDLAKKIAYKIVGEDESDSEKNYISVYTPISRGLIGKEIGDKVCVIVPAGKITMTIIDVKYI